MYINTEKYKDIYIYIKFQEVRINTSIFMQKQKKKREAAMQDVSQTSWRQHDHKHLNKLTTSLTSV